MWCIAPLCPAVSKIQVSAKLLHQDLHCKLLSVSAVLDPIVSTCSKRGMLDDMTHSTHVLSRHFCARLRKTLAQDLASWLHSMHQSMPAATPARHTMSASEPASKSASVLPSACSTASAAEAPVLDASQHTAAPVEAGSERRWRQPHTAVAASCASQFRLWRQPKHMSILPMADFQHACQLCSAANTHGSFLPVATASNASQQCQLLRMLSAAVSQCSNRCSKALARAKWPIDLQESS